MSYFISKTQLLASKSVTTMCCYDHFGWILD